MASDQSQRPSLYPSVDVSDVTINDHHQHDVIVEETIVRLSGAILHLIDTQYSVELAAGDLAVVRLRQGDNTVAVLVRVGAGDRVVQWPLAADEAAVKLDDGHYFFSLHVPRVLDSGDAPALEILNYGLTIAASGQREALSEFDFVLSSFSNFVEQVVGGEGAKDVLKKWEGKEVEDRSAAYWTTLAPNVEDYSSRVAKGIASGSGQLVKGILWCGEVTVDRIKWGDEVLRSRMGRKDKESEVSEETLRRIKRAKSVTKMSEKVATGILSGVVKVSGYVTSSVVNSRAGKKFFSLLPGEIILASLDGFGKVCDAVEVAGKNVLSTSSVVTTGLVSHRYGEQAAEATNQGLGAAGHALGTAWAVFKIRKALDPRSSIKPTTIVKSAAKAAAAEYKAKRSN